MSDQYFSLAARGLGTGANEDNPRGFTLSAWSAAMTAAVAGDRFLFEAPFYNGVALKYPPLNLNWTKRITLEGRLYGGGHAFVTFRGTRTAPWPANGTIDGASEGETCWIGKAGAHGSILSFIKFDGLKQIFRPSTASPADAFTIYLENCYAKNYGGWLETLSSNDGRLSSVWRFCSGVGYTSAGATRAWGNIDIRDCYFDGKNNKLNDNASPNSVHSKDYLPDQELNLRTLVFRRTAFRGNVPDVTSTYPQTDDTVTEEAVAHVDVEDVYYEGSGDRGFDSKAGGTINRGYFRRNGFAIANHTDSAPLIITNTVIDTPYRKNAEDRIVVALESSGWIRFKNGVIRLCPSELAAPAPADLSLYHHSKADINPIGFQSRMLTPTRYGFHEIEGVHILLDDGITQTPVQAGGLENGRVAVFTGLTAGTAYSPAGFTVQAFDQFGTLGATTALSADGTGPLPLPTTLPGPLIDNTPPVAPTGLASSSITDTSVVLSWNATTDNVGVFGYVVLVEVSGVQCNMRFTHRLTETVENLKPGTAYKFYVRAYDFAGNWSASSAVCNVTTTGTGGTVSAVGAPGLFTVLHNGNASTDIARGVKWLMFNWAAASGTVAGYLLKYLGTPFARTFVGASRTSVVSQTNARFLTKKGTYSAVVTYAIDDVVDSGGFQWRSKVSSNLNHTPAGSPTQWVLYY